MKKALLLLAPAALALGACDTVPKNLTEAATVSNVVVVPATQGLLVAHNAYQATAAVAEAAVRAGLVKGENLNRLEALNNRALHVLAIGDRGQSVAQRAAEVMNIVNDIRSIVGR